tara:strand:+ start:4532 stop:6127 length:1596 start_codon:yes stop_codon:yes gene_type:complete
LITQRLLSLAFASADVLLEVDGDGRVDLAIGAGPVAELDPGTAWVDRQLSEILGKASRVVVTKALADLAPGIRSSPIDVLVCCDDNRVRRACLRAFRLPELAPAVSCALTYEGAAFDLVVPSASPLLDIQGLVNRVRLALEAGQASDEIAFAFVNVPGLTSAADAVNERVGARVEAVLQAASIDGSSVARLTPEQFALLRKSDDDNDLAEEVREAGAAEGVTLQPTSTNATMGSGLASGLVVRALRVALQACIEDGGLKPDAVFTKSLAHTLTEAERFSTMVRGRDFTLHFQPIIDLGTGNVNHFEALTRFGNQGPAATVAMAEDLGLIQGLDLAVIEKALAQMRRAGSGLIKIAVNMSGASLANDDYINAVLRMTQRTPEIRSRLLVEVTETAAVGDLESANRRLGALRSKGIKVCLDDFGVGAASFEYLQKLQADTVKVDGSYIRDLVTDERLRIMVSHLVELCRSLKVSTIAEMIENEAQLDTVRDLGIDMGQGFLFGRPAPEPVSTPYGAAASAAVARRQGEVQDWG